jgi:DNA repair protein SbcD/Mre11
MTSRQTQPLTDHDGSPRGDTLRLLHASDLHLGERPANDDAVEVLVELAKRHDVDSVLLVGDIFDHNRVPTEFGQAMVDRLGTTQLPVVILPGNHDPLVAGSIWKRIRLPSNVHLLTETSGELIRLSDGKLVIWGRPHPDYNDMRPLQGIPRREGDAWHVALAHGHFARTAADQQRAYIITADEIAASGWDFIALGHWDVPTDVSAGGVTAVYSGSPSRMGACALVTLTDAQGARAVSVERIGSR